MSQAPLPGLPPMMSPLPHVPGESAPFLGPVPDEPDEICVWMQRLLAYTALQELYGTADPLATRDILALSQCVMAFVELADSYDDE